MSKLKIGIQLFSLRGHIKDVKSMEEVFRRVKIMGAEVVQVSGGAAIKSSDLKKLSINYNLPICITHSPFNRIVTDLDMLAEEHLEYNCYDIGIGMMPKEFRSGTFDNIKRFADILNTASQKLKKYDMRIAYHNHHFEFKKIGEGTIFDYLINNTSADFIPDTFWIKVGGYEAVDYIKKLKGRITTIHLKDYKKTLGVPIFRTPGKGIFDFAKILKAAENCGAKNAVIELDISPNMYKSLSNGLKHIKKINNN